MLDRVLALAGGEQRGLVDDVGEVGAGEAGGARGDDAGGPRPGASTHVRGRAPEDRLAPADVGPVDHHLAVEAAGPQQGRSSTSGRLVAAMMMTPLEESKPSISARSWFSVCSRSSWPPTKPVAPARRLADGVQLVDEHDAGRLLLGLLEEVAHARGAHAHEHLDELGAGQEEERHVGLARHRPGQQRLAGAGRARRAARPWGCGRRGAGTSCGFLRKSTTSISSALASSTPATSAKVVLSSLRS